MRHRTQKLGSRTEPNRLIFLHLEASQRAMSVAYGEPKNAIALEPTSFPHPPRNLWITCVLCMPAPFWIGPLGATNGLVSRQGPKNGLRSFASRNDHTGALWRPSRDCEAHRFDVVTFYVVGKCRNDAVVVGLCERGFLRHPLPSAQCRAWLMVCQCRHGSRIQARFNPGRVERLFAS